ncbi:hypothetical protein MIT9_P2254 [Methylomarinovum caldicuralii]|uniref:Heme chaperone HemW n=1 Tax=Methylomarinovum caldicuralii TaxID=438856 RepID=A0AAU9BUN1_9GAMM|nr:radical SAM family heme chaperone HemW [Methylomarinovum caldicuralii]BCX82668.1 hypothetical protein MIT9_P2254 [Methylomarinovum caldicuralii]
MLQTPPLSLYVHLPWCVRKCPYCDFNSHAVAGELPERAYVEALLADLDQDLETLGARPLIAIFFGGGTPSLFSPESFSRLLAGIRARLPWADDIEITLEANPGTVESAKFEAFRALGINRLSLGVQSFQDDKLRRLGRIHTAAEAVQAVETARRAGFERINLDLMFGLPGQTLADARHDLDTALALEPTHLSWYQLTLEPNTLFAKYPPPLPDDDRLWAMQTAGLERLARAGFERYEISAYARPGQRCRHNLNYWRFGDYLGIGAGAHAKLTFAAENRIVRSHKIRHPRHYLEKSGTPARLGGRQDIAPTERPLEFLMNALRLREGFRRGEFEARTGLPFSHLAPALAPLQEQGLLEGDGDTFRCSATGWNFLDTVLTRLTT